MSWVSREMDWAYKNCRGDDPDSDTMRHKAVLHSSGTAVRGNLRRIIHILIHRPVSMRT